MCHDEKRDINGNEPYHFLQSHYISRAVSHSYGTEYEIWAGFGPVGSTENFGLGNKVCFSGLP